MANAKILELLAQQQAEHDLKHRAARYAATLVQIFRINPRGIDLVCWIAHPSCRNNEEATRHWVARQLKARDRSEAEVGLEELIRRLRRRLDALPSAFPC